MDYGKLAQVLMAPQGWSIRQNVAAPFDYRKKGINPIQDTEGARPYEGGSFQPGVLSGTPSDPLVSATDFGLDFKALAKSSAATESDARNKAAKFDKRIETLETSPDIFVTLKDGYHYPGIGQSFGADSLSEVRRIMKLVEKKK